MFGLKQYVFFALAGLGSVGSKHRLRRENKEIYEANKALWKPLTQEEKNGLKRQEYPSYIAFKNLSGVGENHLKYFLPDAPYFTYVLPLLNPMNHAVTGRHIESIVTDKNYLDVLMSPLRRPQTVLHRISGLFYDADYNLIAEEEALSLLSNHDKLVFKQTMDTSHGDGVRLLEKSEFATRMLSYSSDYVVQLPIEQHESLAYFNDSSVNVIRITTLFWNGTIYPLGGILRIGAPGAFCDMQNTTLEPCRCIAVFDGGILGRKAVEFTNYTGDDCIYGKPIPETLPCYENVVRAAVTGHKKYPQFGIIGWDFTVNREGEPLCIEFNTSFPSLTKFQYMLGPVLEKKSKDGIPLLDEIQTTIAKTRPF